MTCFTTTLFIRSAILRLHDTPPHYGRWHFPSYLTSIETNRGFPLCIKKCGQARFGGTIPARIYTGYLIDDMECMDGNGVIYTFIPAHLPTSKPRSRLLEYSELRTTTSKHILSRLGTRSLDEALVDGMDGLIIYFGHDPES